MKLIIATPSPYARKARIALHEKGLEFTEEVTIPWNEGTTAPTHNPLGKIPILILDDGRAIYDSRVILAYLDTVPGTPALFPSDAAARIEALQCEAIADGVCDAVVLMAVEARRRPDLQSGDWLRRQRTKADAGIAELARRLGSRQWLVGERFSVADIAAGSALGYVALRLPEQPWQSDYPALDAYSARLESRTSFHRSKPAPQQIDEIA